MTIRVSAETHEWLKRLSNEHGLSINDVIVMGLTALEGSKNVVFESKNGSITVELKKNELKPYLLKEIHDKGYSIFIESINAKQVHHIKRIINKTVKCKIETLSTDLNGKLGFLFIFVNDPCDD